MIDKYLNTNTFNKNDYLRLLLKNFLNNSRVFSENVRFDVMLDLYNHVQKKYKVKPRGVYSVIQYDSSREEYVYIHENVYGIKYKFKTPLDLLTNREKVLDGMKLKEEKIFKIKKLINMTEEITRFEHYEIDEMKTFSSKNVTEEKKKLKIFLKLNTSIEMVIEGSFHNQETFKVYFNLLKNKNVQELINVKNMVNEFFVYDFLLNVQPMNPQGLGRTDLKKIMINEYSLTDKADGERRFLLIHNGRLTLYNPRTLDTERLRSDNIDISGTYLVDGEYLVRERSFYSFDILYYKNKDVRQEDLKKRYSLLTKTKTMFKNPYFSYNVKKFYFGEDFNKQVKTIWDNRKKYPYNLDGLIFTPVNQIYTSDLKSIVFPVYKWKDKHSIDVRIEYSKKDNFTFFHHSSHSSKSKTWNLFYDRMDSGIKFSRFVTKTPQFEKFGMKKDDLYYLGFPGKPRKGSKIRDDIIEYEWINNKWVFLRKRNKDKIKPNAKKTIDSTLYTILDDITLDELYNLTKSSSQEQIGNLYDLTKDNTEKRDNWRKLHNFIKYSLIQNYSGDTVLDLACGKGGDFFKMRNEGVKTVLSIDSSYEEIYGVGGYINRLEKEGFTKKENFYYEKDGVKVCPVWGDITKSILKYKCGLSDEENKKLKNFFNTILPSKQFDSVQIMYAIHYMFGKFKDGKWLESSRYTNGFVKNVNDCLKENGNFYGVYLGGENIKKDMKFIKDNEIFYEIKHKKKLTKKEVETLEIKNVVWGEIIISEPKMYEKTLRKTFSDFKITVKDTNVENYIKDFKKKKPLKEDEVKLGMVNKVFVLTK